jgi:threonine dehydrogenase-like Zn-dependent dehydrogenase
MSNAGAEADAPKQRVLALNVVFCRSCEAVRITGKANMRMKALQVVQPRTLVSIQVSVPHLSTDDPDGILVRTGWAAVCGSDIPFFTGSKRAGRYPLPPGAPMHECAGQVVESTSELFQPGEQVVAIPEGDLGLAEFFVARATKAVQLPPELADCSASCLIQPLATVMSAVDRLGDIRGRSIAVVGLGSMGLSFCWLLRKRGAGHIVGIDPCAYRCRMAERFGADTTFPMRSIEVVDFARQDPSTWDPPEICIEAVGHQMETLNDCLALVRRQGTVVAFGVPNQPVYAIEFETFFRKNEHLIAAVTPDWGEYLAKARDLFFSCRDELTTLVTHRFPIHEAAKAFTLYEQREDGVLKILLDASCWEPGCRQEESDKARSLTEPARRAVSTETKRDGK